MNFYDLTYLERQATLNDYVTNFLIGIAVLFLIIVLSLYAMRRLQRKYRDLSIILALFLIFMFGVQYTDYTQFQSQSAQSSQMINFVKQVAHERKLKSTDIFVNSTQLTDGVIVKINDKYFRTTLATDQNSYVLDETHLLTNKQIINR